MRRRKLGYVAFGLLAALLAVGGAVAWALCQVPDFYQRAMSEDLEPATRRAIAKRFTQRTMQFVDNVRHAEQWSEEFTQQQVNSWLAEELERSYSELLPPEVQDPRVQIEEGWVQVGFRYEEPSWSGIVSFKVRPWVPQPNELALEVAEVRAGLMPVPLDDVLTEVSRQFAMNGWRVEWKQAGGNDVLVLHLDGTEPNKPVLEGVTVVEGAVRINGSRREGPSDGQRFDRPAKKRVPRLTRQSDRSGTR